MRTFDEGWVKTCLSLEPEMQEDLTDKSLCLRCPVESRHRVDWAHSPCHQRLCLPEVVLRVAVGNCLHITGYSYGEKLIWRWPQNPPVPLLILAHSEGFPLLGSFPMVHWHISIAKRGWLEQTTCLLSDSDILNQIYFEVGATTLDSHVWMCLFPFTDTPPPQLSSQRGEQGFWQPYLYWTSYLSPLMQLSMYHVYQPSGEMGFFSLGNLESGLEVRQENSRRHPLPVKWAKKQKNNFAEKKVSPAEGERVIRYTEKIITERSESLASFPVPSSWLLLRCGSLGLHERFQYLSVIPWPLTFHFLSPVPLG